MKPETLMEVISAAHLSHYLAGVPAEFKQRGGIMLVAPPMSMKTTFCSRPLEIYQGALILSDLTTRQFIAMRDDIAANIYSTLCFPAFEKLYQRAEETASNIEGHLKAMSEEGFTHAAFEDQRMHRREARCLIVAAIIPQLYKKKFPQWIEDGFLRRFLWCHYVLKDPNAIPDAIDNWEPLSIADGLNLPGVPAAPIPFVVTKAESEKLKKMLAHHEGGAGSPFVLLKKIFAVLKFRYKPLGTVEAEQRAMAIIQDFGECLCRAGAEVDLTPTPGYWAASRITERETGMPVRAGRRKKVSNGL